MGESKLKRMKSEEMLMLCAGLQTAAGRVQVRWETESAATPIGQLAYFIEFLTLSGLWSRWQEGCPLAYTSPNVPTKAEVISEDALRRALTAIPETEGVAWLDGHLHESVAPLLGTP